MTIPVTVTMDFDTYADDDRTLLSYRTGDVVTIDEATAEHWEAAGLARLGADETAIVAPANGGDDQTEELA
jgi:hypothetical protein